MTKKTDAQADMKAIGERLRLTREAIGLTQVGFASKAGIPQNTYNQYEMGRKRPSIDNALAICEAFNVTLDWIYRDDKSGMPYHLSNLIKDLRKLREGSTTGSDS